MDNLVIQTENLSKRYGKFTAVDSLNLTLQKGEVFGLLGPNGAGKTTTILMLLGLTNRTSGRVHVLGYDPDRNPLQVKSRVGYLPDAVGFYDELTARENLIYTAKLNGIARSEARTRIDDLLARMGLADVGNKRVATFSRGMRQRLGVAELLLKQPEVIILDEPTLGLDPEAARQFIGLIHTLKDEGITILLSSHLLPQVQSVCDRVGLFRRGKMVVEGSVHDLAQAVLGGGYHIHLEAEGDPERIENALRALPGAPDVRVTAQNQYTLTTDGDRRAEAAKAVVQADGKLQTLDVEEPSLDEIYARYFEEEEHVNA